MANSSNIGLTASSFAHARPFPAIMVGGLIVGVLDLVYAIVVYSPHQPILVPQTIASGILGIKSYGGGVGTAVLGVILHFVIALGAATVYSTIGPAADSHSWSAAPSFAASFTAPWFTCSCISWSCHSRLPKRTHAFHLSGLRVRQALVLRRLAHRALRASTIRADLLRDEYNLLTKKLN